MKSMYKEFMENDLGILNGRLSGDIYGYKDVFIKVFDVLLQKTWELI